MTPQTLHLTRIFAFLCCLGVAAIAIIYCAQQKSNLKIPESAGLALIFAVSIQHLVQLQRKAHMTVLASVGSAIAAAIFFLMALGISFNGIHHFLFPFIMGMLFAALAYRTKRRL